MMYIEHTAVQGNLHPNFNNRVLTYGAQNNSTTVAEVASELLARTRQSQIDNQQLVLGTVLDAKRLSPKEPKAINLQTNKTSPEFVHLSNGNHILRDYNTKKHNVDHINQKSINQKPSNLVNKLVEDELEEEEEEYQLVEVIYSDPLEESISTTNITTPTIVEPPATSTNETNYKPTPLQIKLQSIENDCDFIIEIQEDGDHITATDDNTQIQQQPTHIPLRVLQQQSNSISLQDAQEEIDEEEFEYIVARVPKKRRLLQSTLPTQVAFEKSERKYFSGTAEKNLQTLHLNNTSLPLKPPTKYRQVQSLSTGIPANSYLPSSLPRRISRKRKRSINDFDPYYTYSDEESEYTGTSRYIINPYETYSGLDDNIVSPVIEEEPAYEPVYSNYPHQEQYYHRQYQGDQMGYDILNKIRNLLSFNTKSNQHTESTTTVSPDNQRKRSYRSSEIDVTHHRQPKYRIIEDNPSKLYQSGTDDDDIQFVRTSMYNRRQKQQEQEQQYRQQLLLNRFRNSSANYRNINFADMSNDHSRPPNDKVAGRKSIFSAPLITRHLVKNKNLYADLEFSDEDEDDKPSANIMTRSGNVEMRPSCSNTTRSTIPKFFNIPSNQQNWRSTTTTTNANDRIISGNPRLLTQMPPLSASSSTSLLQSQSQMQIPTIPSRCGYDGSLSYMSKSKLGAAQDKHRLYDYQNQHSFLHRAEKLPVRILNGCTNTPCFSNMWQSASGRSVLFREQENEEREKYRQLLEQVAPREYGGGKTAVPTTMPISGNRGGNKKLSTLSTNVQHTRSDFILASAIPSSNSTSIMADRKNISKQNKSQYLPLSSTINLDDEDENDLTITNNTISSKTGAMLKNKRQQRVKNTLPPTLIIDDDDISEIVDLGVQHQQKHSSRKSHATKHEGTSVVDLTKDSNKDDSELPDVEPINSFKERFNCSQYLQNNWYDEFQTKWLLRKQSRVSEVENTAKIAARFTTERRLIESELEETLYNNQLTDEEQVIIIADLTISESAPEFVELTDEHKQRVYDALRAPSDQILVSKFNLNITSRDIRTLSDNNWLNDEVINFYMNLLTDRGERKHESHGLPTVYAMNTFFIPRLLQAGYTGVKRWTRKVDIFSKDIIPVPVHVGGVHWCMAIIHLKNRTIKYYDSMATPNPTVLTALEQYLKEESLDKRKETLDTTNFIIESVQNVPRQMNGSDCGVFSCMFAEYITRDHNITFTQGNMEYFRQKMIVEILRGELLQ